MDILAFDYHLPKELIAQEPMRPREAAKLMIVKKHDRNVSHQNVADIPHYLLPTDILVVNNTKVFHARLQATMKRPGLADRNAELFLIRPLEQPAEGLALRRSMWRAIGKPGKIFVVGTNVSIGTELEGEVVEIHDDGTFVVSFPHSSDEVIAFANRLGSVPIPPYIKTIPDTNDYQTAYAKVTGSVAAPTAGFHLTPPLLQKIRDKGVRIVEITLHVGLGTFLPVKTDTLEAHTMHSEWVHISEDSARIINNAKKNGQRIIAVGTTTTRALEGAAQISSKHEVESSNRKQDDEVLTEYSGDVNLFITPGFEFQVIDGLLTNFHLPKSTLLVLVSALAGTDTIKHAYQEAVEQRYRFYSFGDAMLII